MPLDFDEKDTEVARIEISLRIVDGGGIKTAYGYEGISTEEAIGHLVIVLDRMRAVRAHGWDTTAEEDAYIEPDEEDEDE